jgi:predicted nucleotidyltransferase component of viral defense system
MLDARRTAARDLYDLYDLELLVARGVCPERSVIESLGGGRGDQ